jgi:intraflagellar transport protein 74
MLSSGKDKMYLEEELKILKKDNTSDSERIELIYNRRRDSERQVSELEQKIEEERNKAHSLIESINPHLKERYETFQSQNTQLQGTMERLQMTLDDFNSKKSELYDRICRSELKKKAAEMEEELLEAEEKRDALLREAHSQETPEEERERLLAQVKIDNLEITTLERQIAEISDQIKKAQEEIQTMDQEIEETDSDRQQKFRELRKREQEMDEFMQNFEENKNKECEALSRIEAEIVNCMERISRNVHLATTLPE